MFEAIKYVTGGVTVVASLAAVVAAVIRTSLKQQEALIRSAPEEKSAELVNTALEGFRIDTAGLTRQQKYEVLVKRMADQENCLRKLLNSGIVLSIVAALPTVALQANWFPFSKSMLPAEVPTEVPPATVRTFDELFDKLDPGQIAFGAPKEMGYGETKPATLLLSKTKTIQELEQSLKESELVLGHTIKVADVIEAHLSGNEFEILAVTPEVQAISGRDTTEWTWDIKPKDFGSLPLHLSVNAKIMLDGQERTRAIRTFDETVYVHVTWPRSAIIFVRYNWQWLWTTLLVPLAGWLWHRNRKRKKKRK